MVEQIGPVQDIFWEKRGVYDESRLSELVLIYQDLGFEVRICSFEKGDSGICDRCIKTNSSKYKTLFTRIKLLN